MSAEPEWPTPSPGENATLGRYLLVRPLPVEGPTRRYVARDTELDREVLIRLLPGDDDDEGPLRDARAQARLAHPGVVPIHDVGWVADRRFIATALLEGPTLAALLEGERLSWPVLLDFFVQAGSALAAAHEMGLAHRHFSAEAIHVNDRRRAQVDGFFEPQAPRALSEAVRADRACFLAVLSHAMHHATGTPAPRRLRRLLKSAQMREESAAPLAALLASLATFPRARRRRAAAALAVLGLVALALAFQRLWPVMACGRAAQRSGTLWSPTVAGVLRHVFLRTGKPYADATLQAIDWELSAFLSSWNKAYRHACEDVRRGRGGRAEISDLRVTCLEGHLSRLRQALSVLANADEGMLEHAATMMAEISDPARLAACDDISDAHAEAALSADPSLMQAVRGQRDQLGRAEALRLTGRYPEGLGVAQEVSRETQRLAYAPLHTRALFEEARLLQLTGDPRAAEEAAYRALWAAQSSRQDRLVAQSWILLTYIVGVFGHRLKEGEELARHAAASLRRCGGCEDLWADWHIQRGNLFYRQGSNEDALREYQAALKRHKPPISPLFLADHHARLGQVYAALERTSEALSSHREAARLAEQELGPAHPELAIRLTSLAMVLGHLGRHEESVNASRRALRIRREALGHSHPLVGQTLGTLGAVLTEMGRLDEARDHLGEALSIQVQALGPEHPMLWTILIDLGNLECRAKRPSAALSQFQRALRLLEQARGPELAELMFPLVGMGRALLLLRRPRDAIPLEERALRLGAGEEGLEGVRATARFVLAQARWEAQGARDESLKLAEQARASYRALGEAYQEEIKEVSSWLAARGR